PSKSSRAPRRARRQQTSCEPKRGQVAQVVERSPEKAGVGGSTPSLATIIPKDLRQAASKTFSPRSAHDSRLLQLPSSRSSLFLPKSVWILNPRNTYPSSRSLCLFKRQRTYAKKMQDSTSKAQRLPRNLRASQCIIRSVHCCTA